jgi:hypothetical protein
MPEGGDSAKQVTVGDLSSKKNIAKQGRVETQKDSMWWINLIIDITSVMMLFIFIVCFCAILQVQLIAHVAEKQNSQDILCSAAA